MKDREKHSITPFEKWVGVNYAIDSYYFDRGITYCHYKIDGSDHQRYSLEELKDKYIEYLESKNKEYYKFSRN